MKVSGAQKEQVQETRLENYGENENRIGEECEEDIARWDSASRF